MRLATSGVKYVNAFVALYLAQDGVANGLVYALLAMAIVLLFSVTRIIFIPQGEFVTYGALTFTVLQDGRTPGTIFLLLALIALHLIVDLVGEYRRKRLIPLLVDCAGRVMAPLVVVVLSFAASKFDLPLPAKALVAVAVVGASGPLLYRLVYQPIAGASVLVLMIVSVALHFVLVGFGLYLFGPSGQRSAPLIDGSIKVANVPIGGQTLLILAVTLMTIAALYYASQRTLYGKAMLAVAINRAGARLMGISTALAGRLSFLVAATIGAVCGVLIAPTTTILYDTGFLLGLKGFVAAILGGLASFPLSALGGILIGLLESYSAFAASSYKEVIVFGLVIPILLFRSMRLIRNEKDEAVGEPAGQAFDDFDPKTLRRQRRIRTAMVIGFVVAVMIAPIMLSDYDIALLDYVGLASIAVLGLVLLTGVAGLTSFSQAAYVGIGAYITGYLTSVHGLSPWLTLFVVLIAAFLLAFLNSLVTVRLSGHYLPLATLAIAIVAYFLFGSLPGIGGQTGMSDIPAISVAGYQVRDPKTFYIGIWGTLLLLMLGLRNLLDSRPGRAIRSLRYGTIMAESVGVNTKAFKIASFVIACLMAAVAGWLYAHFQRFLNPSPFSFGQGIEYLFMAVIGGVSSIAGAVAGAALVVLSNQWLQAHLPSLIGIEGDFEIVVFGIAAVAMLQFLPEGIWPFAMRLLRLDVPSERGKVNAKPLPEREKPPRGSAILSVCNVHKLFGALAANRDVSLDANAGEILALIGPNGAGKSTLFDVISGVLWPTSGSVNFLGKESKYSTRALALDGMGRTFQHVRIIPDMTVLENVALGAHARSRTGLIAAGLRLDRAEETRLLGEAQHQLARVGLGAVASRSAGSLSLGQQRVLEIARVLCGDPCLLLLDEPAAGLRHLEKKALAELLLQLKAEGMAIVIVEHDMDFVMNLADRVVVMQFGEKLVEGTPKEIQANPKVIEAYLGGAE
jgi:branched-chain amino acid transport system ATP-binding protein